jgi:hypothetical protein
MALVKVDGNITLPKSGYTKFVYLWELYDLPNGVQTKRRWNVWTDKLPTDIVEGSWIEVQGDFGMSVSKIDGAIRTYEDKSGNQITSYDISINNVEIIKVKAKENHVPDGVDLDDVRKYGTPLMQTITDESPF